MLTVEEREEIEAKLADYPNTRAVAIEAMLIIQRHQDGYRMRAARSLRPPAAFRCRPGRCSDVLQPDPPEAGGRHVALICDSISCWIMALNGCGITSATDWAHRLAAQLPTGSLLCAHRLPGSV